MAVALIYLAAIVAANLAIAAFGAAAAIPVAFVLVGLDLTARDRLHDRWRGHGLAPRMALLIAAGGAISWLVNRDAGQIAMASTVAFIVAAVTDGLVYHLLRDRQWALRVNASNLAGAASDSLIFPALAFGAWLPLVVAGQFAAKVAGGAIWSLVLRR
jgi:hypothetical protein